jgi:hypothetical protein
MATRRRRKPESKPEAELQAESLTEGIEFADEEGEVLNVEDPTLPQRSEERDRLNQQVAVEALRRMHIHPEEAIPERKPPVVPLLSEKDAEKIAPKVYQVLQTVRLPQYTLPAGKVFTENEYDVGALMRAGVQLKEVEPASVRTRSF